MTQLLIAYALMALNPFGGLFIAIPIAMWKLHWPAAVAVLLTSVLQYSQVLVVELGWKNLLRWPRFVRFVEAKRSDRVERLLDSRYGLLWVALVSPWLGPWLVAALARFAGLSFRRVMPALFAGILYVAALAGGLCLYAPDLLPPEVQPYLE